MQRLKQASFQSSQTIILFSKHNYTHTLKTGKLILYMPRTNFSYRDHIPLSEALVLIILIFGLYNAVFIYFTPTLFIPYGICFIFLPYIIYKSIHMADKNEVVLLSLIILITFIGLFISPQPVKYFMERVKGFVHLFYSIVFSYFIFLFFLRYNPNKVARIFGIVSLLIIIGCILENYFPPFRTLSNNFRHLFFKKNVYEADLRDLILFGSVRPRLFTTEPSHVAKFFILSLFIWFTLTMNKKKYILFTLASVAGLFLIKSPVVVLIYPLAFVAEMFLFRDLRFFNELKNFYQNGKIKKIYFRIFFILIILVILLALAAFTVLSKRVEQIIHGEDLSFLMRIFAPPWISYEVLKQYPIFGIGITAKELLISIITNVFKNFGFIVYDINAITNVLWLFIIYYGLGGSLLILFIGKKFLNRVGIYSYSFLVGSILIFSQTMGGYVTIRWWFVVFMFILVNFFRTHHSQFSVEID